MLTKARKPRKKHKKKPKIKSTVNCKNYSHVYVSVHNSHTQHSTEQFW